MNIRSTHPDRQQGLSTLFSGSLPAIIRDIYTRQEPPWDIIDDTRGVEIVYVGARCTDHSGCYYIRFIDRDGTICTSTRITDYRLLSGESLKSFIEKSMKPTEDRLLLDDDLGRLWETPAGYRFDRIDGVKIEKKARISIEREMRKFENEYYE